MALVLSDLVVASSIVPPGTAQQTFIIGGLPENIVAFICGVLTSATDFHGWLRFGIYDANGSPRMRERDREVRVRAGVPEPIRCDVAFTVRKAGEHVAMVTMPGQDLGVHRFWIEVESGPIKIEGVHADRRRGN